MDTKPIHAILMIVLIGSIGCDNRIIERSAGDYFPFKKDNWWAYYNGQDTIRVEVLDPLTVLGREAVTVSFGGDFRYWLISNKAVEEYVEIVYCHGGTAYPIIEDFYVRNERPLVSGYYFRDSILDSIMIAGIKVRADFVFETRVAGFEYHAEYDADVYHITFQMMKRIDSPDTVIVETLNRDEYYAPGIGIVRYVDDAGDHILVDYYID